MSLWAKVTMVSILVVALPATAEGQAADTVFVGTEHSPWTSGFLEFVFPTAGFAYAGDWKRGLLPNAFRVGALIGFAETYDDATDTCEDDCTAWSIALLATTVWAIVGAAQTATDYNAAVREPSSTLLVEPSSWGGLSVGLRIAR